MPAFHPKSVEELPAEIPVFPLPGALLLPGGRLPLNIFEKRYLAMVEDALGAGRMFGMIQPDRRRPAAPTGPALYRIGCLGRLSSFSETEDGRFLITLNGVIRFAVVHETAMRRGYRRVAARFAGFEADLEQDPLPPVGVARDKLLQELRAYFARRGFEANWAAINEMPDPVLVITLCMVCPFDVAEKQALLEAATPSERAHMLLALLQIGVHDTADDAPPRRSLS